jgi:transcriptional regulator GlxA family with amidase domain
VVEAEPRQPFHVADLCRALGVSARSLARYSIEHLGMPAHRYLWLRRMQMAHRALRAANPATTSVTRIAHDHGFGELGRFAVAYRDLFGEPPSATLRRPAGA